MRKGYADSISGAFDLTLRWSSGFSKVKMTWGHLISSYAHADLGCEGTPTECCKDQTVFKKEAVCCGASEHITGFHCHVAHSARPWDTVGPSLRCPTKRFLRFDCNPYAIFMFIFSKGRTTARCVYMVFVDPPWPILSLINLILTRLSVKNLYSRFPPKGTLTDCFYYFVRTSMECWA